MKGRQKRKEKHEKSIVESIRTDNLQKNYLFSAYHPSARGNASILTAHPTVCPKAIVLANILPDQDRAADPVLLSALWLDSHVSVILQHRVHQTIIISHP